MGRAVYRAGYVVSGDYSGRNIYQLENENFFIVDNDENGKIIFGGLFPTSFQKLQTICHGQVDHYEDVSSAKTGPNTSAIADGVFWGGALGGLIGAVATNGNATHDIAVYFKDGKKSLIRILNSASYQALKSKLFAF